MERRLTTILAADIVGYRFALELCVWDETANYSGYVMNYAETSNVKFGNCDQVVTVL